jgi:hypothetical protein
MFASDDGNHLAYVGSRGGGVFVGIDDREDPPLEEFSRSVPVVFGGAHDAYGGKPAGGEYRLILDGRPIGAADVAPMEAAFSPDGERLAYVEMRMEPGRQLEYRIVLDGQAGGWFSGMRNAAGAMQFSPDGKRFAHYTIDGKGHARWHVDGVGQRAFNDVRPISIATFRGVGVVDPPLPARFSPDGRRFAYFADVVEKGVAILEDDVAGPLFKAVGIPVFSPDSRHLAYAAQTFTKTIALVRDGAIVGEWPGTGSGDPVFSPDGGKVALTVQRQEGGLFRKQLVWSLIVDGQLVGEEPGEDGAAIPAFGPDGEHVYWWVKRKDGRTALVIDGAVQDLPWSMASDPRFDASGRLVFVGTIGAVTTLIVDGQPGPSADELVSLRTLAEIFGSDPWRPPPTPFRMTTGGHVAWAGRFGDTHCPVFDQDVGPAFDDIVACRADGDAVRWWAQRDDTIYTVGRQLGPARTNSGDTVPGA